MADFAHDTALELPEYAEKLKEAEEENSDNDEGRTVIGEREKMRLIRLARKRKRRRLLFFNNEDGLKLRLNISNHPHVVGGLDIYCALCGQNRGKEFRGHRTNQKCNFCDVQLCIYVRRGFRKSCWEVWHTARKLKPRIPMPPEGYRSSEEEDEDGEASRAEMPQESRVRRSRRLSATPEPSPNETNAAQSSQLAKRPRLRGPSTTSNVAAGDRNIDQ